MFALLDFTLTRNEAALRSDISESFLQEHQETSVCLKVEALSLLTSTVSGGWVPLHMMPFLLFLLHVIQPRFGGETTGPERSILALFAVALLVMLRATAGWSLKFICWAELPARR